MYIHKYTLNISKNLTSGKMLYIDLNIRYTRMCMIYTAVKYLIQD